MLRLVGRCVLLCATLLGAMFFGRSATVSAQQPAGNRPAAPATGQQRDAASQSNVPITAQANSPRQPDWFPLSPEHEKYLNDILKFWEFQAGQVQRYRCNFVRWEYEPAVFPINPDAAVLVSTGNIQYAAPDKGLFKVDAMWDAVKEQRNGTTVAVFNGKEQQMTPRKKEEVQYREHWICDGKSIYEYRPHSTPPTIVQTEIPPDLQGSNIADGPLPFLFGAKATAIKARYWVHVIQPQNKKPGRFYLEAIPKRREEAADFRAIHIVIDEQEFLPEALLLFHLDGSHDTFEFQNREKNWNILPEMLNPFHQQFYAPKPPPGWKIVKEAFQQQPPTAGTSTARSPFPSTNGPRQATQGSSMPQRR